MTAGLYFSANDAVSPWATAFLRSFRAFNPALPAYLIPFDDHCDAVRRLCDRHDIGIYEHPGAFAALERIGASLELGRTPHGPRWFRRYAAFADDAPLAEFVYLDARTLVLSDLTGLIAAPRAYGFGLTFTDSEVGQVYNSGPLRARFLGERRGRGFNSGRWASRRRLFSLPEMERFGRECVRFRDQLNARNTDQAFLNYCCDAAGVDCGHFGELAGDVCSSAWAGSPGRVYRDRDGTYRRWDHRGRCGGGPDHGKRVPLLHWAGLPLSPAMPEAALFDRFRTLGEPALKRITGRGRIAVRGAALRTADRVRGGRTVNSVWHEVRRVRESTKPRHGGASALRISRNLERPLRLLCPIRVNQTTLPGTGVTRHVNAMLHALAARPGVEVELFASARSLDAAGRLPAESGVRDLPVHPYRLPEGASEKLRKLAGRPALDRHAAASHGGAGCDAVYSPADTVAACGTAKTLLTLHDPFALDPLFPHPDTRSAARTRRRWAAWVPRMIESADVLLTVSAFSKSRIEHLLDTAGTPVEVVGNGVAPEFFAAAEIPVGDLKHAFPRAPANPPGPYLLVLAGLCERKGAGHVLAVADELRRRGSELHVVVAGRSEPRFVAAAGRRANVTDLGPVPDSRLVPLLRGAAGLLFLSLYEGFGLPAAEAMACGVPVIAADRTALPGVVGDAGVLLDPAATGELADAALELAAGGALRDRMIAAGRRRAAAFTWDACADRLLGFVRPGSVAPARRRAA